MSGFDFEGAQIDIFNQRFKDSLYRQHPSGDFSQESLAAVTSMKQKKQEGLNKDLIQIKSTDR